MAITDYSAFLESTPEEIMQDWLLFIQTRDPLLKDTSKYTFNSILAEAIASQFYVYIQLLKQKVHESNVLTATGAALSAIVLAYLPEGRYPGEKSTGSIIFRRPTPAPSPITIPAGILCAMKPESGGSLIQFQTTAEVTIPAGAYFTYAPAEALNIGTASNVGTAQIAILLTPVIGVTSITNDAPFTGGSDGESDDDLRARALYTIWIPGKATVPLMQEHVAGVEDVREVKVSTVGQGDVLLVVDSVGGIADPEGTIGDMIAENLAAGCTCPGILAASIRPDGGSTFEINDCSGGYVWVRTREFLASLAIVPFIYLDLNGQAQAGTVTFPAGSPPGATIKAVLQEDSMATVIVSSDYAGTKSFDLFMGLGLYPYLWVAPTIRPVNINLELVLTTTPEADLLTKVKNSLTAKLSTYRIGDVLQWADLVKYIYIDYDSGTAFNGIDDVSVFEVTCREQTISGFGESITIDPDGRVGSGTINVTEAT